MAYFPFFVELDGADGLITGGRSEERRVGKECKA